MCLSLPFHYVLKATVITIGQNFCKKIKSKKNELACPHIEETINKFTGMFTEQRKRKNRKCHDKFDHLHKKGKLYNLWL